MQAIRKVIKVENNQLKIDLPENLFSGLVEVIILPFKNQEKERGTYIQEKSEKQLNDFQKLLLSGPIMGKEELQFFTDKKKHFDQWK